jgi:hypothetical protein
MLSNRRNMLFLLVLVVLVPYVLYLNFVSPAMKDRDSKQSSLDGKKKEIASLQQQIGKSNQATPAELVKLSQTRRAVPEEPYVEGLIRDMRMLETVSGLKFEAGYSFDTSAQTAGNTQAAGGAPAATTNTAAAGTAPASGAAPADPSLSLASPIGINQTVKGTYKQIYRLLEEIQTSQRYMQVNRINFTSQVAPPVRVNQTKQELTCSLSLTAYYSTGLKRYFKDSIPVDANPVEGRANPLY